jgi:hypothetical protein
LDFPNTISERFPPAAPKNKCWLCRFERTRPGNAQILFSGFHPVRTGSSDRRVLSDQLLKRLRTWLNSFSVRRATALIVQIALLEDGRDLGDRKRSRPRTSYSAYRSSEAIPTQRKPRLRLLNLLFPKNPSAHNLFPAPCAHREMRDFLHKPDKRYSGWTFSRGPALKRKMIERGDARSKPSGIPSPTPPPPSPQGPVLACRRRGDCSSRSATSL